MAQTKEAVPLKFRIIQVRDQNKTYSLEISFSFIMETKMNRWKPSQATTKTRTKIFHPKINNIKFHL